MYTNTNRLTGMSGLDTTTMIKNLMASESLKYNNLLKKASLTSYRQESYRGIATTMSDFQSKYLSLTSNISQSMRLSGNYKSLVADVKLKGQEKSTNDISIKAEVGAKPGNYKLIVEQIAQKDEFAGDTLKPTLSGTEKINVSDLAEGDSFKISLDGATSKEISFDFNDIMRLAQDEDQLENILNEKLNDAFGTDSLLGNAQKITASVSNDGKLSFSTLSGHNATLTSGAVTLEKLGLQEGQRTGVDTSRTLEELFGSDVFDSNGKVGFEINGKSFTFDKTDSFADLTNEVNNSGAKVKLSFDNLKSQFILESESEGAVNAITFKDTSGSFFEKALKIGKSNSEAGDSRVSKAQDAIVSLDGVRTTRETNSFSINGLSVTLSNDSVNREEVKDANGNVTDTKITPKEFNINITTDASDTKSLIMNFVEEYNKLIDSINTAYRTERPKSVTGDFYEPLTDQERSAMNESQIKSWDEEAKKGLLFRDSILDRFLTDLRYQMNSPVTLEDGRKISLFDIGITTSGAITDGGKLEIDEAKLDDALANRSEDVMALFSKASDISYNNKSRKNERLATEGIAERINDIINDNIGSKGYIYEKAGIEGTASEKNNVMYWDIKNQTDKISNTLSYLQKREDYYYDMFSKIEAAMIEAESQMASLQSMMGF